MKSNAYQLFLWYIICLIFLCGLILGTIIVSGEIIWGETVSIVLVCAIVLMAIITLAVRAAYKKALKQEVRQESVSQPQTAPTAEASKKEPVSSPKAVTSKQKPAHAPAQQSTTNPIEDRYPPITLAIARYIVRTQRCVISDLQAEFNISRTDVLSTLKPLEHAGVIIVHGTKRLVIPKDQDNLEEYLTAYMPEMPSLVETLAPDQVSMQHLDPMFAEVARYVVSHQEGSVSRLQRAFEIGFNRAGKLSDQLEAAGIVGPNKGPQGRDVLIQDLDQLEQILAELGAQ